MITVIDYDAGNLRSVVKAFEKAGAKCIATDDEKTILNSAAVVLPGVGAFSDCMESLEEKGMDKVVRKIIGMGKPFLGICLGFQLLFSESEEHEEGSPNVKGLGIFEGRVRKFPGGIGLKIPHMGWNSLKLLKPCPLFEELPRSIIADEVCHNRNYQKQNETYLYFVHSYYVEAADKAIVSTRCSYGLEFDAAISKDNIFATQFHPEKSGKAGAAIIKNFLKVVYET
jgi:glutamine amidotransferase